MKITVKETFECNGNSMRTLITASSEIGTVVLKDETGFDRDKDFGTEKETRTTEYADAEAFYDAGYDTSVDISPILPVEDRVSKREQIDAEKKAALAAGEKAFVSKVDGSYWLYRPRKKTWQRVDFETYMLNS